jgi:hypothetical protein
MQNARASGVGFPCRPGDQEIQAEAKAGFQNAPLRCISPGSWQIAATEKNLAGLVEAAELAVIAIAESGAVGVPSGIHVIGSDMESETTWVMHGAV